MRHKEINQEITAYAQRCDQNTGGGNKRDQPLRQTLCRLARTDGQILALRVQHGKEAEHFLLRLEYEGVGHAALGGHTAGRVPFAVAAAGYQLG